MLSKEKLPADDAGKHRYNSNTQLVSFHSKYIPTFKSQKFKNNGKIGGTYPSSIEWPIIIAIGIASSLLHIFTTLLFIVSSPQLSLGCCLLMILPTYSLFFWRSPAPWRWGLRATYQVLLPREHLPRLGRGHRSPGLPSVPSHSVCSRPGRASLSRRHW